MFACLPSEYARLIDVCWAENNTCRENDAAAALVDRYLYLTLEKCKLYHCYDPVWGTTIRAVWDQLSADDVTRDSFDSFCSNTDFYDGVLVRAQYRFDVYVYYNFRG